VIIFGTGFDVSHPPIASKIRCRDEPFRIFNEEVQAGLAPTVFDNGGCSSYYLNARRKNCAAWPFSTGSLRRRLSRFDLQNYHAVPCCGLG